MWSSSPPDPLPPAAVGLVVWFTKPTLLVSGDRPKAGRLVFAHGALSLLSANPEMSRSTGIGRTSRPSQVPAAVVAQAEHRSREARCDGLGVRRALQTKAAPRSHRQPGG